jgi:hypothetical protein
MIEAKILKKNQSLNQPCKNISADILSNEGNDYV